MARCLTLVLVVNALSAVLAMSPYAEEAAPIYVFDMANLNDMAFYIDAFWLTDPAANNLSNATLTNHDFFISQRAFFFDLHVWVKHNLVYAERYDLTITGFIIDGHSPGMGEKGMEAYMRFSPDGIVGQKIPPQGVFRDTMPFIRMKTDLYGAAGDVGKRIASMAGSIRPKFMFLRTILQSPSWHKTAMDTARANNSNIEFVDPYTFFLLLKEHERKTISVSESAP